MLEWYTVKTNYLDSITVTEDLFSHLLGRIILGRPATELSPPFLRLSMEEAFHVYADIDLGRCQELRIMKAEARARGILMSESQTWEEAFHILFLTLVEPHLPREKPLVLMDYPALIPTTARRRPGTPWSERWELYIDGVEIANCYTEETNPGVLHTFVRHEQQRRRQCHTTHLSDPNFADLFPPDFPECSGTAIGVDRLEMVFAGETTLEGVILFPFTAVLKA
jgi:lysyl-tRNA synthetase class 2